MLGLSCDESGDPKGPLWHLPSRNVRSSPFSFSFYTFLPSSPLRSPFYFIIHCSLPCGYLIPFPLMQLSNTTPNSLLFSTQNILRLPIHYPLGSKGRAVPRVVCCAIPIARAAGKVLVVTSRKQPNNWLCKSFFPFTTSHCI